MIDLTTPHGSLLGLPDRDLKLMAGMATHQHFKGGLYRLIGTVRDSVTGEPLCYREGRSPVLIYEHLYPHEQELWSRSEQEFNDGVDWEDKMVRDQRFELNRIFGGVARIKRFRKLGDDWGFTSDSP